MNNEMKQMKKIGTTITSQVVKYSATLYISIPKDVAQVHNIQLGDKVEAELKRHYRPLTMKEVNQQK